MELNILTKPQKFFAISMVSYIFLTGKKKIVTTEVGNLHNLHNLLLALLL